MGTVISTARFAKSGYIKWKLSLFAAACAIVGSIIGSNLSLLASEKFLKGMMLFALPVVAFYVLKNKDMGDNKNTGSLTEKQMMLISMAAALVIGCAHIASHICVKRGIDKNLPLARQWARY